MYAKLKKNMYAKLKKNMYAKLKKRMYSKLKKYVRPRIYIINPWYDKQKKNMYGKKSCKNKKLQMSLLCHRSKYSSTCRNCVFLKLKDAAKNIPFCQSFT